MSIQFRDKVSENLSDYLRFIELIKSQYQYIKDATKECDSLTQDYLHKLELEKMSYSERAKIATRLKEVRIKRREYKDIDELITPIFEWQSKPENSKALMNLKQVLGMVRKVEDTQPKRKYWYRALNKKANQIL